MGAANYDRTAALFFSTVDDTADANIFGQNCLNLPGDKIGDLVVLDSDVDIVDSFSSFNFYHRSSFINANVLMGARIDTDNDNDGYYGGINKEFTPELVIFKRVSGVLSQLIRGGNIPDFVLDTEFIMKFDVVGSDLEISIVRKSTLVVIDSLSVVDNTFSNSGTVSIFKAFINLVARDTRIDKHTVSDVA